MEEDDYDLENGDCRDTGIGLLEAGDEADDAPAQLCNNGRELYSEYSSSMRRLAGRGRRDFFSLVREDIDAYIALKKRRETGTFVFKVVTTLLIVSALVFTFVAAVSSHCDGGDESPTMITVLIFAILFQCFLAVCNVFEWIPEPYRECVPNPYYNGVFCGVRCRNGAEYRHAKESVMRAKDFLESMLNHCVNDGCSTCARHTAMLHVFKSIRNKDAASFYLRGMDV